MIGKYVDNTIIIIFETAKLCIEKNLTVNVPKYFKGVVTLRGNSNENRTREELWVELVMVTQGYSTCKNSSSNTLLMCVLSCTFQQKLFKT